MAYIVVAGKNIICIYHNTSLKHQKIKIDALRTIGDDECHAIGFLHKHISRFIQYYNISILMNNLLSIEAVGPFIIAYIFINLLVKVCRLINYSHSYLI